MSHLRLLALPLSAALAACSGVAERRVVETPPAAPAPTAAAPAAPASALDKLVAHERLAIMPQPSADDLRALKAQGYTHIVNIRTPAEMDDRKTVPFDEAALAAELGLDYVHLPQGGEAFPFRPELADGLAAALQGEGKVLLHCASGARASLVYAAYLVKHRGVDPDIAMRETAAFGMWPLPLERMSGVKLTLQRAAD